MNRPEFLATYLPEKVDIEVAFGAMAHFLAMHFNGSDSRKAEVATFIRSITNDELGRPASREVFELFKEALVGADRLERVGLREITE